MKTKIVSIVACSIALALVSCDTKEGQYYERIAKDGEITVTFIEEHNDLHHELYWSFIDGEVDQYKSAHNKFGIGPQRRWDARFITLTSKGPFNMKLRTLKNEGTTLDGKDNVWHKEIELHFLAPKDSSQSNHQYEGKVKIKGVNALGDGSSYSESWDAQFNIRTYVDEAGNSTRESVAYDQEKVNEEIFNFMKEEDAAKKMDEDVDTAEEEPSYATDFVGTWSGKLGEKDLVIVITSARGDILEGHNVVGNNKRPVKGTVMADADVFTLTLSEPGDDTWDGVFTLKVKNDNNFNATGHWKANNGKSEKQVEINKK